MKCQILFSEENKKNISKCRLLNILHRALSFSAVGSVGVGTHRILDYSI